MWGLSDEDNEGLALRLRQQLGIHDDVVPSITHAVDQAKSTGLITDYEIVDDVVLPRALASWSPQTRTLTIRESTWCPPPQELRDARFTIAHELGHAVLDHSTLRNRAVKQATDRLVWSTRTDEEDADRFAGAFLAPFDLANFTEKTTARQVADRFGMSFKAAKMRLQELGRIYRRRNGIERRLPAAVLDFLTVKHGDGHPLRSPMPDRMSPPKQLVGRPTEGEVKLRDPCLSCGRFDLIGMGTKVRCGHCKIVYDRFQDGDDAEQWRPISTR